MVQTNIIAEKNTYKMENNGIRVENCPIGQRYCYISCFFRKGERCCYKNEKGIIIPEIVENKRKTNGEDSQPRPP
jgi:hypothetical protein